MVGVLIQDRKRAAFSSKAGSAVATIDRVSGVGLTSAAFASGISWFSYVLAIVVVLFAFSTMISWSYFGLKTWTYMFGEGKISELMFKIIFYGFSVNFWLITCFIHQTYPLQTAPPAYFVASAR